MSSVRVRMQTPDELAWGAGPPAKPAPVITLGMATRLGAIGFSPVRLPCLFLFFYFFFTPPPPAIIEHVRDGSVVRALLLPDYYLVTVMLSGVKVWSR